MHAAALTVHNKTMHTQRGFTLAELLVSIGVMAILSGLVLAVVNPFDQFQKANDARRKSDLAQVQRALEQYYQDNRRYPARSGAYQLLDVNAITVPWGGTSDAWRIYMPVVPKDPSQQRSYAYYVRADGQAYWLYASLERGAKDPDACNNGTACSSVASNNMSSTACGNGVVCNFAVTSPNVTP